MAQQQGDGLRTPLGTAVVTKDNGCGWVCGSCLLPALLSLWLLCPGSRLCTGISPHCPQRRTFLMNTGCTSASCACCGYLLSGKHAWLLPQTRKDVVQETKMCCLLIKESSSFLRRVLGVNQHSGDQLNRQTCLNGGLFLTRCISRPGLFGFLPRNTEGRHWKHALCN